MSNLIPLSGHQGVQTEHGVRLLGLEPQKRAQSTERARGEVVRDLPDVHRSVRWASGRRLADVAAVRSLQQCRHGALDLAESDDALIPKRRPPAALVVLDVAANRDVPVGVDCTGEVRVNRRVAHAADRNHDRAHSPCDVWMQRVGKAAAGHVLDGAAWQEFPDVRRG